MPTNINGIFGLFNTLKLSLMFFCKKFGVKDTANNNKNTLESYKISFGVFKIVRNILSNMKIMNDTIIPVIKANRYPLLAIFFEFIILFSFSVL